MLPRESRIGLGGQMLPPKSRPAQPVGPVSRGEPQPSEPQQTPPTPASGHVSAFLERHLRHYNAGTLRRAADAYVELIDRGGQMMVSLAGAMSTAELGLSLAPMIRAGKIHAISCTGANLEEDVFRLVGHDHYIEFHDYQDLTREDDDKLADAEMPRVTDSVIPEKQAMAIIEDPIGAIWKKADQIGERLFPHEALYELLLSGVLKGKYQKDPDESWMLAAAEKNLPIVVPGWEDSTLGNVFAAGVLNGEYKPTTIKGGIEYMTALADWYKRTAIQQQIPVGFFQIGGGIAGDFAICAVPMLEADAGLKNVPKWAFFAQITDATESYGGYSGAMPQEKQSWLKIDKETPAFAINSDATVCFPLVAARVMNW